MVVEYANYLQSQGHDVVIMTNIVDTMFDVQVRVRRLSSSMGKLGTVIKACFLEKQFDLVIADIIVLIFFLLLRGKNKLLYFAQDYDESYYKKLLMKMLIRTAYLYCLKIRKIPVIAVSDKLQILLKKTFDADVRVVPNGVDTEVFYPDRDERYLSLKGGSKVVLIFARNDYRKGFDIAVAVLSRLKGKIDDGTISVWAVGEKIKVPFTMENFGFVPPEILRKLLSCSDVLLYPSRHEGLPLFVLEAMACNCPVVTTEAVDITTDGISSLKCGIEDAIGCHDALMRILTDDLLRDKLVANGLREVENHSLSYSKACFEEELKAFSE